MSRWRRIAVQAPLGFGAGLPLLLTGGTLRTWLADADQSLVAIGWFGSIGLAYNFKWLWAPLLDRFSPPLLGRRRGWILLFQVLLLGAVAALGSQDPGAHAALAVTALAIAFLSASQDIVVDAYRTDVLRADERGKGVATYVIGYRVALIAAGAGALILADFVSWRVTYWVMAGLMAVGMAGTLLAPEPPRTAPPRTIGAAVVEPLRDLLTRPGVGWVLAFVLLYKLGDAVAGHWIGPFLLDVDFSKAEIGFWQKGVGMAATIGGVALGGAYSDSVTPRRALLAFGVLQAVANAGYIALAVAGRSEPLLVAAIAIDNVCNGLGTAAFVAFLMALCRREFSAFQYALLGSASTVLGRLVDPATGYAIEAVGWAWFFGLTMLVAAPALVLLAAGKVHVPERPHAADPAADPAADTPASAGAAGDLAGSTPPAVELAPARVHRDNREP